MLKRLQLTDVRPNPDQPRKHFDRAELEALACSIAANGLMQPITVRPVDGGYEIVAGERRFRAHQILAEAGRLPDGSILAHVRRMDDEKRDLEAIIENLQRADVTPLEEARAFSRMVKGGMSVEALAGKIGVAAFRIRERLQLLELAPQFLKLFEGGQIDRNQAFEIARLASETDQARVIKMIAAGQIGSWKSVRAAVDTILQGKSQADIFGESAPRASAEDAAQINAMEQKIETMARLAAAGWKDGECIVAVKVSRDRARLMADKLGAMKTAIAAMERDLRMAAAQAEVVLAA